MKISKLFAFGHWPTKTANTFNLITGTMELSWAEKN